MTLTFDLDTPLLDEGLIEAARIRRQRLLRIYLWILMPAIFVSLLKALDPLHSFLVSMLTNTSILVNAAASTVITFMLFVVGVTLIALVYETLQSRLGSVTPLSPEDCGPALALVNSHPKLKEYRKAVAASRAFTYGDLAAMLQFVTLESEKEKLDKRAAACRALHDLP